MRGEVLCLPSFFLYLCCRCCVYSGLGCSRLLVGVGPSLAKGGTMFLMTLDFGFSPLEGLPVFLGFHWQFWFRFFRFLFRYHVWAGCLLAWTGCGAVFVHRTLNSFLAAFVAVLSDLSCLMGVDSLFRLSLFLGGDFLGERTFHSPSGFSIILLLSSVP